jgi:PIN domain nuclease of toxin-antitoxin system
LRLLLDTHVLIWALAEPRRLKAGVREIILDRANDVLFSAASIWEIAIKAALGRADFGVSPQEIAAEALAIGLTELPVRSDAAARVAQLAPHHRDPFDRLLIAQALVEPARLYTADTQLAAYTELVVTV